MGEQEDLSLNPFSMEKAFLTFQENMRIAAELKEEIDREAGKGTVSDRELLMKATEALGRLTDQTILVQIIRRALEARDAE